jgi:hypothetical protein
VQVIGHRDDWKEQDQDAGQRHYTMGLAVLVARGGPLFLQGEPEENSGDRYQQPDRIQQDFHKLS